jgi:MFS family permease
VVVRFAPLAEVFRARAMRRAELGWAGYYVAEWSSFVALSVYVYGFGGATAVGLLGLVRAIPALLGVLAGTHAADRMRRERVLVTIQVLRAGALAAAAAVVGAGAAHWLVFLLAGVAAGVGAAYRPAQLALMPLLARTPQELVATNVCASMLEGLAVLVGPVLAGVLLGISGADSVLWIAAGISLWSAVLLARVPSTGYVPARRESTIADLSAGARALARAPHPRLIIFLFASQTFVRGLLNVLLVVLAFRLLNIGEAGVGFLNAVFGVGGLIGGVIGVGLVGLRRLAQPFSLALVMWGAPIALVALWPHTIWAGTCLIVVGVGNALLDVSGFTLIQRGIDDAVLARVFGVFELLVIAALGVGSIAGSLLVSQLSIRPALLVAGGVLPLLTVLNFRRLRAVDACATVPERELRLLESTNLFAPLPPTTLERLAAHLLPLNLAAGTEIVREGDTGDAFYLISSGRVEVVQNGMHLGDLGPGEYFGEIALLNDVPRTASCAAVTDVQLCMLDRERFVAAVTGNLLSVEEVEAVIDRRLADLRV